MKNTVLRDTKHITTQRSNLVSVLHHLKIANSYKAVIILATKSSLPKILTRHFYGCATQRMISASHALTPLRYSAKYMCYHLHAISRLQFHQ